MPAMSMVGIGGVMMCYNKLKLPKRDWVTRCDTHLNRAGPYLGKIKVLEADLERGKEPQCVSHCPNNRHTVEPRPSAPGTATRTQHRSIWEPRRKQLPAAAATEPQELVRPLCLGHRSVLYLILLVVLLFSSLLFLFFFF